MYNEFRAHKRAALLTTEAIAVGWICAYLPSTLLHDPDSVCYGSGRDMGLIKAVTKSCCASSEQPIAAEIEGKTSMPFLAAYFLLKLQFFNSK